MSDQPDEPPRSVRRHAEVRSNVEMTSVGYAMLLGLLVLLLPLLPFLVIVWGISRLTGYAAGKS
ncbi:hypothetical protein [Halobacterium sp. CBA1126]|uniref:DUF7535 family protein n=1 Tax=Halobacterium TaxID=2239 RepID=UPI0012FA273B|nr:hypothetical protein [Halobacterium sp. CBA1126]MUV61552.1 hypothetical protein [Halobacterium sp. CBA1126]